MGLFLYTRNCKVKMYLKGQCHEIFCFCFFYESVSPQPQSIPLGPFRIFLKICGYIRKSRCTRHQWQILPTVSLVLLIPVANLPPVSPIPAANCHRHQIHQRQICHRCSVNDTGVKQWEQYRTADNLK